MYTYLLQNYCKYANVDVRVAQVGIIIWTCFMHLQIRKYIRGEGVCAWAVFFSNTS